MITMRTVRAMTIKRQKLTDEFKTYDFDIDGEIERVYSTNGVKLTKEKPNNEKYKTLYWVPLKDGSKLLLTKNRLDNINLFLEENKTDSCQIKVKPNRANIEIKL